MTANLRRQVSMYPWEMLWAAGKTLAEMGLCAWFFYRSFWALFPLLLPGFYRFCGYARQLEKRKKREFENQFQECILAVAASLRAGYSLENAFSESVSDMKVMFGAKSKIVWELQGLGRGLRNNQNLGRLLTALGARSDSETVKEFADIVNIGQQSGGNLVEIIGSTARIMAEERELHRDIETTVSGKRMEGMIMRFIPFFLMVYIQWSNPGYFDFFYYNGTGVLLMTGCLGVYLFAVALIDKILEIAK